MKRKQKLRDLSNFGYLLPGVTITANYPHRDRVWNTISNLLYVPEFIRRLNTNDRRSIKNADGTTSTHLMSYDDEGRAFPLIQDVNGRLIDYRNGGNPYANNDFVQFATPGDASYFSEHYKEHWPEYFSGFKNGKDTMIYNFLPAYLTGKNGKGATKKRTSRSSKPQINEFDAFANGIGHAVYRELHRIGAYTPQRYNNIMSLLSGESGHGTSGLARYNHNYGGRKAASGGWMTFKDDPAFAADQIAYIRKRPGMWNARSIREYANAAKKAGYMEADLNKYITLLEQLISARRAWEKQMQTWAKEYEQPRPKLIPAPAPVPLLTDAILVTTPGTRLQQLEQPTPVIIQKKDNDTSYVGQLIDPYVALLRLLTLPLQQQSVNYMPEMQMPSYDQFMSQMGLPMFDPMSQSFGLILVLANPYENQLPMAVYGKDSGIHIKPSHRGRFTEYLLNHPGMTAEKAKHSDDPRVRKMATFAINARSWHH